MNIAILGLGVVGRGVYDILMKETSHKVSYIVEIDDQKLEGLMHLKAPSFQHVLDNPDVDVIVELIGGKTIAYDFVKAALRSKKHVVTANKALISAHFQTLQELADRHQVQLRYEASVAGATMLLTPLIRMSHINQFNHIYGIMNGTTNFVLTQIFKYHRSMSEAIEQAKALGYIETGSNDDMEGLDAMRKINILSMLAYHTIIEESSIVVTPLNTISDQMIDYLKSEGYRLKYIALSKLKEHHITIEVCPLAIMSPSIYDHIDDEMNIVMLEGTYHQKQAFIGQGAGRYPTATAIISDIQLIDKEYSEHILINHQYEVNSIPVNETFIIETLEGFMTLSTTTEALMLRDDIRCYVKVEATT